MTEELDLIKDVVSRLTGAGIDYMMTGSMAMAAYSIPRMTMDIDMVIQISPDDVSGLVELFKEDFYIDEASVREAATKRGMFNVINNDSIIKLDFIVRKDEEYRVLEFSRRQQIDFGGASVWVVAPEDLILSKLVWHAVMSDTTPEMEKRFAAMMAAKSPAERLRMASSMFETGKALMRAGILRKNPALDEAGLRGQIFVRLYGDEFTESEISRIVERIPNMRLDTDS